MQQRRLSHEFYCGDVLDIAPALIGKAIVRSWEDGRQTRHIITETEAYRGEEDLACHASKGKTTRTAVMYGEGGNLYMYLIYGMYWMMNVVTSVKDNPQAVLIRGLQDVSGPGRLTRRLQIDGSYNQENLITSPRIWIEDNGFKVDFSTHKRIGIDYAGEIWKNKEWRFLKS